jgi:hypothetical protein
MDLSAQYWCSASALAIQPSAATVRMVIRPRLHLGIARFESSANAPLQSPSGLIGVLTSQKGNLPQVKMFGIDKKPSPALELFQNRLRLPRRRRPVWR